MRGLLLCSLLIAGCIRSPADIPPLPESPQITGTLVERDPRSGQLRPVPAAQVKLVEGSFATTSLEDGFFMLGDLPLGVHGLDLSRGERFGRPVAARRLTGLRVETEVSLDLGNVELGGVGDLTGDVRLADAEELPSAAAGSIATVVGTAFSAVVGSNGEFLLAGVPEGDFVVAVYRPGYFPQEQGLVPVTKNVVTTVRPYLLERDPNATPVPVAGAVVLMENDDPSGVLVTIEDEVRTATPTAYDPGMTDSTGEYVVSVPPGVYRITFEKDGFRSAELRGVAVFSAEDIAGLSTVYLGAGAGPEGDPDGDGCAEDAFPDDPLECTDADGDGQGDSADPDDDNDGLFDVEEVSPGLDGWITDPTNADTDGDSVADPDDLCPVHADPGQEDADGDGVGDACDFGPMGPVDPGIDVPPTITGFTPTAGPPGALVVIDGADFNPNAAGNLVYFGDGAVAYPEPSSSGTQLQVRVPISAQTGLISVANGFGTGVSSVTFTVLPGPVVNDVQPRRVAPGGTVTLTGSGLDGAEVVVAGSTLASTPGNPPEDSLSFTAPMTPGSFPIRLRKNGGESLAPYPLVVRGGPSITSVSPTPVAIGQTLSIFGAELVGTDAADTEVELPGAGVTAADLLTDNLIQVVIPAGTNSGLLTVRHLASGGSAQAQVDVDPQTPFIQRTSHLLVEAGDTITLFGTNLDNTTDVTIGGVSALNVTPMAGSVSLEVPAGVLSGPVVATVTTPSGPVQASAPLPMSVLNLIQSLDTGVRGFGFGPGGEIYVAADGLPPTGQTYSADLVLQSGADVNLRSSIGMPLSSAVAGFSLAPTGTPVRRGVVTANPPVRAYAVELPGWTSTGSCDLTISGQVGGTFTDPWTYSDDGQLAFTTTSQSDVVIFDLVAGTCQIIDVGAGAAFLGRPVQVPGTNELLLPGGILGFGTLDLTTRMMAQPFTLGAGVSNIDYIYWFYDAAGNVWGQKGAQGQGGLRWFNHTTGDELGVLGLNGQPFRGAVTYDRRFLFGDAAGAVYVVDTANVQVAHPDVATMRLTYGIATHPTQPRVLIGGNIDLISRLRLFEIDVAP